MNDVLMGKGRLEERWCCCKENHQDRPNPHYHVAIKLNKQRRWLSAHDYIAKHYNIQVNFSDKPGNYYEAWLYCTKSDREIVTSDNHPDFTRVPRATTELHRNGQLPRLTVIHLVKKEDF